MGRHFFERYGSRLKLSFEVDSVIDENDKLDTLNETEIFGIVNEIVKKTKPSHTELLGSLTELNVCTVVCF